MIIPVRHPMHEHIDTVRFDAEETGELDKGTLGFLGICISVSFFSEKLKKPNLYGGF